jgi:diguanylate cyclase (GGDEF)-like protein/PAS domain S-box-containing protein
VGVVVWVAAMGGLAMRHTASVLWLANGLLIGIMLISPKRRWAGYLVAGYLAEALAGLATADRSQDANLWAPWVLSIPQAVEALVATALLRRLLGARPDLTRTRDLGWFTFGAVILAPAISAAMGVAALYLVYRIYMPEVFPLWFMANALGIATQTPLILAINKTDLNNIFGRRRRLETTLTLMVFILATVGVFLQSLYPLLFVIFPLLLLVSFRLGLAGSAISVQLLVLIAIACTYTGRGPTMLVSGSIQSRVVILQVFFFLAVAQLYPIAAFMEQRRRSESRYRLMAESSADVISLINPLGIRTYASPAVNEVLGWAAEEITGKPSSWIIHPDDREQAEETLQQFVDGADSRFTILRTLRKDGSYLWIEANIRAVHDSSTGALVEILASMRDVSSRVEREVKLEQEKSRAETMAAKDALTGLANRRSFDAGLNREWLSARESGKPISLLMIDVDFFKLYNDTYGHQAGDDCLRRVADAISQSVRQPYDLPARYGGEEFGVVLHHSDETLALGIAQRILTELGKSEVAHSGSALGTLTASIGVATIAKVGLDGPATLVEAADRALYAAKHAGRNRAVSTSYADSSSCASTIEHATSVW